MPTRPAWLSTIVVPVAASLIVGGLGGGMGVYVGLAVVETRLDKIDKELDELARQDRSEAWGGLVERVNNLEMKLDDRAGDDQLRDWISWRATVNAWRAGVDVDIRDLQQAQ